MYQRFLVRVPHPSLHSPVQFVLCTQADNPWGKPTLRFGDETWPVDDPRLLHGYFYDCVLNVIIAGVRSHFLIHAGVVARDGRGIILAGDAAHGKTTLTLELVGRGFKFLSDEMAALGRADRRVHPFPRSLRIDPKTLELTGLAKAACSASTWLGKWMLDIEDIQPNSIGEAADICHVVVLRDPVEDDDKRTGDPKRELGVFVNRIDRRLLQAVRQIEGVNEVHSVVERGYPVIRLRAAQRMAVLSQVEAICHEQRVLILDISKREERHPTFDRPARLERIPNSQAVLELLRRFQGGHKSALLQEELGGDATRLFVELAEIVRQATCYQLFVGRLDEMAELVCSLVT
jgi:hypothetical protein